MKLNYDAGRQSNKPGGENIFERPDDTRDYYITLSYTPAYNTYSWKNSDNTEVKYYTSSDDSYVTNTAAPEAITEATSYKWESSHTNVVLEDDDSDQATATYETKFSTDTDVTITATATIAKDKSSFMTEDVTLKASDTVTLKSRYLSNLQLLASSSPLYIGQTTKITAMGNYDTDATITYSSQDNSIAEVAQDGTITAKGTNDNDSYRVIIKASLPQTSDYEADSASITITVMKHPTKMTLNYDKNALTYGEEAPQLTACTLTDGVDNSEMTGTVSYSNSYRCVDVNASTGTLTINYAGTAVITATYSGDDTHMKASATFTVTVSKATTTLAFEQSGYIAQTTHQFTSPVATLTPAEAGSVAYSYTSTTEGLIALDANTGAVTLNTLTGTATVTATFAGNDKYEPATASYVLTVTSKEIPDLEVTTEFEFFVDATYKIHATTTASADITFESNDTDVITVGSDGTLNAVGEGQAFIRITSVEDDTYMAYAADYPVTVKRYPTEIKASYQSAYYYTDHVDNIIPNVTVYETVNNDIVNTEGMLSYSTEQTGVLTVDAKTGQVTMVGDGIAAINIAFAGDRKYAPSTCILMMNIKKVTTPGTFIRLKDHDGNYLSSDGTKVDVSATADASNIIWYGEDRSLLFYQCGRYLKDATPALADVVNADTGGKQFTFTHHEDEYTISDGTNTLTSNSNTAWTMEEVSYLPVTFKEAGNGFATLYSPVDLSCPAGVVAYYPTARKDGDADNTYVITLKSVVGGYIPHSTPLVLYTQYVDTYKFYIVDEDDHELTDLWSGMTGTLAAINTLSAYSGTHYPYTLQPTKSTSSAGFYPWKSGSHTTIDAFRSYIPGSTAANANAFRFVIDDNATGIDSITPTTSSDAPIYNVQGIAVGTDLHHLPAGVYIRNGKKIVKK